MDCLKNLVQIKCYKDKYKDSTNLLDTDFSFSFSFQDKSSIILKHEYGEIYKSDKNRIIIGDAKFLNEFIEKTKINLYVLIKDLENTIIGFDNRFNFPRISYGKYQIHR